MRKPMAGLNHCGSRMSRYVPVVGRCVVLFSFPELSPHNFHHYFLNSLAFHEQAHTWIHFILTTTNEPQITNIKTWKTKSLHWRWPTGLNMAKPTAAAAAIILVACRNNWLSVGEVLTKEEVLLPIHRSTARAVVAVAKPEESLLQSAEP